MILSLIFSSLVFQACQTGTGSKSGKDEIIVMTTNPNGKGQEMSIAFSKGSAINHPLLAIWAEDTLGRYLQTFYVSTSIATSIFDKAINKRGKWTPGLRRLPAALPVWSHAYGYVASDGLHLPEPSSPVADAYSGATPGSSFLLNTRSNEVLPAVFNLYLEINQSWDWNDYWHNARFPESPDYATSAQPSVVYHVRLAAADYGQPREMKAIGHGHYAGSDGEIYPDISTLTTALKITSGVSVTIK